MELFYEISDRLRYTYPDQIKKYLAISSFFSVMQWQRQNNNVKVLLVKSLGFLFDFYLNKMKFYLF